MSLATNITFELLSALSRAVTGQLYTDRQIKVITSGTIGKYLSEFFPAPKEELAAKERVQAAEKHISAASSIIQDMQKDLEAQNSELGKLIEEVEQKKQLADRYQALAQTNKQAFDAFRAEMENALRKELQEQAVKGKRVRQFVSIFLWFVTLIIGAALGTYFKDIVAFFTNAA